MILFLSILLGGCDAIQDYIPTSGGGSSDGSTTSSSSGSEEPDDAVVAIELSDPEPVTPKGGLLVMPGKISKKPPEPQIALTRKQCGDFSDGGPVPGPDCVTAELSCDQTVYGYTTGGVQRYNTRFYEQYFCTPATTQHDGGDERVYLFRAPPDRMRIWFTLDTPCADLDLAVIAGRSDKICPATGDDIPDCEMWPKDGNTREVVDVPSVGNGVFYAVVEGKGEEEGAFALTVQCGEWM